MRKDQKRDYFAGVVFLLISILVVTVVIPMGVKVPSTVKVAALSPDFWPRIIAFAAGTASLFLIFETWKLPSPSDNEDADAAAEYQLETLPATLRVVVLIVALFLFYISITTLGVVAASVVLMFAMMLFYGERNFLLIAVLSISIPLLLYLFFRFVASVPMPLGIFGS